jgi:DNA polymerase III delta subunit
MIVFLYGSDSYRRLKKVQEIVGEYQKKHSNLNPERFDLNEPEELDRLKEFASALSIFDSVKLAVVSGIFGVKTAEAVEFLKSNLKSEDITLLISENESPSEEFGFLLKKPVLSQEFKNLEGERLKFFIKKEAQSRNIKLTARAINYLAENFKENSWGLITELDKISLSGGQSIDINELQKIGDFYESPKVFNFIGLFFKTYRPYKSYRSYRTYMTKTLESLFLSHEEPAKIFNILASMSRSPQLLNQMADYDVAVKSGKLDYEGVLLELSLSVI